jgi:LPS sulfotransferase NodH
MAATGVLGDPDEFFNPRGPIPMWLRQYPAPTMRAYIHTLRQERASPNGVFSVKTTFLDLVPTLDAGLVTDFLGRTDFIYLTRRDLIAQAISAYLAEGSGVWHRDQSGDVYRPSGAESSDPPFDELRILQKLDEFVVMQQQWERTFALYSIDPLRLTYEDFVADASAVVRRIASYLGVEWSGAVSLDSAVTAKLGNEQSATWAALIRANHRL